MTCEIAGLLPYLAARRRFRFAYADITSDRQNLGVVNVVPVVLWVLRLSGKSSPEQQRELWARYRSWLIFIPLMAGPILLGAAWVVAAVALMSLLCYREFARGFSITCAACWNATGRTNVSAALENWRPAGGRQRDRQKKRGNSYY